MRLDKRATCLNCMDGRVQLPVLNWILENYSVSAVDVITAAGMDGILASKDNIDDIISSIKISLDINRSGQIFVAGHHDCKGNPVDEKAHRGHVTLAVRRLKGYWPKTEVLGLWVNSSWQVELLEA